MERLLITGASGFIGSHLVRQALEAGYEVWAAVRKDSNKTRLESKESSCWKSTTMMRISSSLLSTRSVP